MIEIENLTKRYGGHTAVDSLTFKVEPGQIYGFLGPNGAGKTTTMNILTGCLAATEGNVRIHGWDIFEYPRQAKSFIGYLPELPPLYPDMTVFEYLRFVGEAKGLRGAALKADVSRSAALTGVDSVGDRLIKQLSKGFRQRVGLSQAVIGDPETLILDEPMVGLDPRQIIELRDIITDLGREHTVILSSHILSEVSTICSRLLVLSHGRLVAEDSTENLERRFESEKSLDLIIRGDTGRAVELVSAAAPGARVAVLPSPEPDCCGLRLEGSGLSRLREPLFTAFAAAGLPLLGMTLRKGSLEDVFLTLTEEEGRESEPAGAASPAEDALPDDTEKGGDGQ